MNAERSLAHIETIIDIHPIPDADRIVLAKVLGWNVVVGKDEFRIGDKVVYIEIDSRLNTMFEPFAFLTKDVDKYGFVHIKTKKLRGVYSQGLCIKVPEKYNDLPVGADVSALFNKKKEGLNLAIIHNEEYGDYKSVWVSLQRKISKFGRWWRRILHKIFPNLGKKKKVYVPSPYDIIGVGKTDETRIQALPELFERLKAEKIKLIATEKLDGSSSTYFLRGGEYFIASRNTALYYAKGKKAKQSETFDGSAWQLIETKYFMREKLEAIKSKLNSDSVLIQGEAIGSKIQGNPYKFAENEYSLRVFNIKIDGVLSYDDMKKIGGDYDIETVPFAGEYVVGADETMESFVARSDGKSVLNQDTIREGLVYRSEDYKLSFKAVSNAYLLEKGE